MDGNPNLGQLRKRVPVSFRRTGIFLVFAIDDDEVNA
jgi:hypothetical protein